MRQFRQIPSMLIAWPILLNQKVKTVVLRKSCLKPISLMEKISTTRKYLEICPQRSGSTKRRLKTLLNLISFTERSKGIYGPPKRWAFRAYPSSYLTKSMPYREHSQQINFWKCFKSHGKSGIRSSSLFPLIQMQKAPLAGRVETAI